MLFAISWSFKTSVKIEELKHTLKTGAAELGIILEDKQVSMFFKYAAELKEWNKKINLTAIVDDKDIVIRHFLDSLTIAPFLVHKKTLLDIGSGAGFPGIPLKIAIPELKITLFDSVNKKVIFMRNIIRTLGLKDIEAVHARAEHSEIIKKFEGSFDIVTSRAFAELGIFLKTAAPYAKTGEGIILAVKGPKGIEELKGLKQPKDTEYIETKEVKLPFTDIVNTILFFKKTAA